MARVSQEILDKLIEDCIKQPYEIVVSKWIVEATPALFNGDRNEYLRIKALIAKKLGVDMCSVVFVGSSSTGFSLNPQKNFKTFDVSSDIDIAIVSHYFFNEAWHSLRLMDKAVLSERVKKAYNSHRSHYIFDGTIATDKILSQLPFGVSWRMVINEIKREPIFNNKDIHFRLYQDHKSLIDYHVANVRDNLSGMLGIKPQSEKL